MKRNRSESCSASLASHPAAVESLEPRQFLSAAPTWIVEADPTTPAGAAEQFGGEQTLNVKIDDIKSAPSRNLKIDDIKSAPSRNLKIDDVRSAPVRNLKIDDFRPH
jgi:hypothetical protein